MTKKINQLFFSNNLMEILLWPMAVIISIKILQFVCQLAKLQHRSPNFLCLQVKSEANMCFKFLKANNLLP
jgi:hypothetical protein